MSLGDHMEFRTYRYRIMLRTSMFDAHAISWVIGIVLMRVLYYTDRLEILSVFSNNATLNFSTFWPRSHASFLRSKNGKLTSETTLVTASWGKFDLLFERRLSYISEPVKKTSRLKIFFIIREKWLQNSIFFKRKWDKVKIILIPNQERLSKRDSWWDIWEEVRTK